MEYMEYSRLVEGAERWGIFAFGENVLCSLNNKCSGCRIVKKMFISKKDQRLGILQKICALLVELVYKL